MDQLLNLQLKLLILMMIGALMKWLDIITEDARKSLIDLVIYLILPCNIVISFLQEVSLDKLRLLGSIFVISVGIQIVWGFIGKRIYKKENRDRNTILYYGTICSNAGFLGNVIAEELFGSLGLALASVYLIPQRIIMWSAGVGLFSHITDRKKLLVKVATHPCVLSVFIGLFLMIAQIQIPSVIYQPLNDISRCNTAISMIVIGTILKDVNMKQFMDKSILSFSVVRLVIIPLSVYWACRLLMVDEMVTGVATLLAAMPVPITTAILADKYHGDAAFASKCIVITTLLSIITIPVWSTFLV